MARDDVAQRDTCMDTEEEYARSIHLGIKRKRRWENTEYKHRIQSHDAHRLCTLSIKRRCAIISKLGNHEYEGWENIKIQKSLI